MEAWLIVLSSKSCLYSTIICPACISYFFYVYRKDLSTLRIERQNESAALDLIRSFKEMSSRPDIEKAYIMEYKYYRSIHDDRQAIAALEEAINLFPYNCYQCSLIYAEYLSYLQAV